MTTPFFDLKATHNPNRWYLQLEPKVCVGPPDGLFMFGGVGLGSAIRAMEQTCGRPVIWATAQYLSYARPPSIVDLDVWVPASGKYNSQARVISHVGDKEILTVNAALGKRQSQVSHQWVKMPDVPKPLDCPLGANWRGSELTLHGQIETRVAYGQYGEVTPSGVPNEDGRLVLWVRSKTGVPVDASFLAIIADFVPSGIGNALGRRAGGNSLDNTIRYRAIVPTEWVLCDISIQSVHAGFGHGTMQLFAEDGQLMATASQSVIVRLRDEEPAKA